MSSATSVIKKLKELRAEMIETESAVTKELHGLDSSRIESAKNQLHYMALRRHDIRELQDNLAAFGLSSLGRCESHVMSNIDSILGLLARLETDSQSGGLTPSDGFMKGRSLLDTHTRSLLGERPEKRNVYIMVRISIEAATDFELVRELLKNGMNCMRINCAHDDAAAWFGPCLNQIK